jgi:DNA-binding response OmpR family regulator
MAKKVLVIEDSRNIVAVVKIALEACGYEVKVAQDGVAAMEEVFASRPDLILLDLVIPKMDGFMVLEGLKKEEKTRNIPVIVISAKAAEEDIKRARELGASEYMVKPFNPEELRGTVAKVLGQRPLFGGD